MPKKKQKSKPEPEPLPEFIQEHIDTEDLALVALLQSLPYDKLILSAIFTYAWVQAYSPRETIVKVNKETGEETTITGGQIIKWTKEDIMLGLYYGFTIPPALQGGIVANSYACTALGYLGIGLIPANDNPEWDGLKAELIEAFLNKQDSSIGQGAASMVFDVKAKFEELLDLGVNKFDLPPLVPVDKDQIDK